MIMQKKHILIVMAVLIFLGKSSGRETESFLSVQDIFSVWQKNYGDMNSMKVSYSWKIVSAEPSQRDPNFVKNLVKWSRVEILEEGKKYVQKNISPRRGTEDINNILVTSFDGTRYTVYFPDDNYAYYTPELKSQKVNSVKSFFLTDYLDVKDEIPDIKKFSRIISMGLYDPNFTVSVRPLLENISGQKCHVIEQVFSGKTKEITAIIWVAHEKGMLPMKSQVLSGGKVVIETLVEEIDFTKTENGGLWFPKKAYETTNLPQSLGVVKQEYDISEFVPNIKTVPNTFQLVFPAGTRVADTQTSR